MIDEDTDELKQHTDYTVSYNQDREMDNIPVGGKRVLEEFPRIKKLILDKFNFAAEEILRYKKRQYSITSSWLTSTSNGQFSQTHNHRNSFYSGVYYYDEYKFDPINRIKCKVFFLETKNIIFKLISLLLCYKSAGFIYP